MVQALVYILALVSISSSWYIARSTSAYIGTDCINAVMLTSAVVPRAFIYIYAMIALQSMTNVTFAAITAVRIDTLVPFTIHCGALVDIDTGRILHLESLLTRALERSNGVHAQLVAAVLRAGALVDISAPRWILVLVEAEPFFATARNRPIPRGASLLASPVVVGARIHGMAP